VSHKLNDRLRNNTCVIKKDLSKREGVEVEEDLLGGFSFSILESCPNKGVKP
jgi:hypothetical protein